MNTSGGYGQYISVPGEWVTPLPAGLSLREHDSRHGRPNCGALCREASLDERLTRARPCDCDWCHRRRRVGGGSLARNALGFEVIASSGKANQTEFLTSLGACRVIHRDELSEPASRPLLAPRFAHGIDAVGGDTLSNVIKQLEPQGSVAVCGLVASPEFAVNVFPSFYVGSMSWVWTALNCHWLIKRATGSN